MERNNFKLKAIKLMPDGGVYIEYNRTFEDSGTEQIFNGKDTNSVIPHPDLRKPFETGKMLLFIGLGYQDLIPKKHEEARQMFLDQVSCHKVTITGKEDNQRVVITGKVSLKGSKVAINSPLILVKTNSYGLELDQMAAELEDEAFEYLVNGKKTQQDINSMMDGADGPGNTKMEVA